jgi:hypothetical protein
MLSALTAEIGVALYVVVALSSSAMAPPETTPIPSLKTLRAQRAGIRGKVTTLLKTDPASTDIQSCLLKLGDYDGRLQDLDNNIQNLIEDDGELEKDIEEGLTIHERIIDLRSAADRHMAKAGGDDCNVSVASQGRSRAKLPKLEFKPFSGDPLEWQPFWDRFSASVDRNEDIFPIDKFVLLTTLLDDGPGKVIKGLAITTENYEVAVSLLSERYGKTQVVINAHMEALLDIPKASDPNNIRSLYDTVEVHMRGLEALGKELDGMMLCPIILKKLPNETKLFLSRQLGDHLWDLQELRVALLEEVQARERAPSSNKRMAGATASNCSNEGGGAFGHTSTFVSQSQPVSCNYCDKLHRPTDCPLSPTQRREVAVERRLCFCCLRSNHSARTCRSQGRCRNCNRRSHHTSLCDWYKAKASQTHAASYVTSSDGNRKQNEGQATQKTSADKPPDKVQDASGPKKLDKTNAYLTYGDKTILMKTALVNATSGNNARTQLRVIFDDASQLTYITEEAAQRLGAKALEQVQISSAHFRAKEHVPSNNSVVGFHVHCRDGIRRYVEALVVDSVAPPLYRCKVTHVEPALMQLPLADPECLTDVTFTVDVLIGGVNYYDFIDGNLQRFSGGLVATSSRVGWVLTGPAQKQTGGRCSTNTFFVQSELCKQVERFWNIESIGITDKDHAQSDVFENFKRTVTFENNRYWARFPWIPEKAEKLDTNRDLALCRFRSLQRKLRSDDALAEKYTNIIHDQIRRGFIEVVPNESASQGVVHYIAHHPVVKGDSRTTKVRIVYDASAKGRQSGLSLNDVLHEGPNMVGDLFKILINFRISGIGLVSDIEKAFLQVGLQPTERDCTRFFWSDDPCSFGFTVYRFVRVCFGVISSPFLLNATLNHHLSRDGSQCAITMLRSMYVDNCVNSVDSVDEAVKFYNSAKNILAVAGMNLREWKSNSSIFSAQISSGDQVPDPVIKVLGIKWDTRDDTLLTYPVPKIIEPVTKRSILQLISSIFDPLGFFAPVTIKGRILLQKLWQVSTGWDEPIADDLCKEYQRVQRSLHTIADIPVERWLGTNQTSRIELHGFADASPEAYAAVVYARISQDGGASVRFLAAKSRVAPIKSRLTIPRLELLAILICKRLCVTLCEALGSHVASITIWSDSSISLCWVKRGAANKDVFVRNRVCEIVASGFSFRFVNGYDNPADLATRLDREFDFTSSFWWKGPSWLSCQIPDAGTKQSSITICLVPKMRHAHC